MRRRDPRVNASVLTFREYLITFLFCNTLCAVVVQIYAMVRRPAVSYHETFQEALPLLLSIGGFIVFASLIISLLSVYWGMTFLAAKVGVLSDAAQKVAAGDYSVRIPPQRKDGKKDEMEVLYEDFNSMAQQLGEKKILREDFLSNVSHEFKTPLSVINNYVTILQSGTLSEAESREYLERVRLSSLQLSDMVGNILQISRLENGKITAKKEDYDLSEQLAETVLGFDRKLTENEIDLEADWDDEIGIFSDPGLLQIVWNNLLSNAVKFTPRGGNIRIAAQRDGSGARVSFSDSGCGIAEQDISRIFEKFYQADTSRKTRGNGLGLAMVKEILDLLGCRIEIQSRIGQGSVFTVWIP